MDVRYRSNKPQDEFLTLPNKYRAFVAGYGSGKTWVGCQAECENYWQFPKVNQGYFAPTYSMIRDIFYPTIEEVAFSMGLNIDVKEGNHEVHFYSGRQFRGTTICRSLDHPQSIIGFKIGHASIDELDTLPILKAEDCWRKIIARMRYKMDGLKNGIDVMTTPEGFRFCHKLFVQAVQENPELKNNYGMIQASTYDNEANLPADYIPSLKEIYPAELIEAYINGQFVNLTSGTVYRNYDRVRCNSDETIQDNEPLFIGQDFKHLSGYAGMGFHAHANDRDARYIGILQNFARADPLSYFFGYFKRLGGLKLADGKRDIRRAQVADILHDHIYAHILSGQFIEYPGSYARMVRDIADSNFRFTFI